MHVRHEQQAHGLERKKMTFNGGTSFVYSRISSILPHLSNHSVMDWQPSPPQPASPENTRRKQAVKISSYAECLSPYTW